MVRLEICDVCLGSKRFGFEVGNGMLLRSFFWVDFGNFFKMKKQVMKLL